MPLLTTGQRDLMLAMLNDRYVRYPQRVRFLFYSCKDQLGGRPRIGLVKRLDQIMAVALLQTEEWHAPFRTVLAEAVHVQALHRDDHDFFLAQLGHCVPGREDKPPFQKSRRIGQRGD